MPNPHAIGHNLIPRDVHSALYTQRGGSTPSNIKQNKPLMASFPSLQRTATALTLLAFPAAAFALPQDLRDFDHFIHHVRLEAKSGDPQRIQDCFATQIVSETGCSPVGFSELFGPEATRFGWTQVGGDIARFADGFALTNQDGTMVNLHARAKGRSHHLDILGNRVKLRREAGSGGDIIAMLDQGLLPGKIDHTRWEVSRDDVEWTPVLVEVPGIGKVRGYIGSDYVRLGKSQGDLALTAQFDGERWALTGYERIRPELAIRSVPPTP